MVRRALALCLLVVLAGSSTVLANAANKPKKMKGPKGAIRDVSLTLDPNTGNALVVMESKGAIYAGLAKDKGKQFAGKKAKTVSSKGGNYRPASGFDVAANEFLAVWDTGPEDLFAAAARAERAPASDILGRRINSKKGKGSKGVVTMVSDGATNIGPQLLSRPDRLSMAYMAHAATSRESRSGEAMKVMGDIFRAFGDPPETAKANFAEGIWRLSKLALEGDFEACTALSLIVFGGDNSTAFFGGLDELAGAAATVRDGPTPTVFKEVVTKALFGMATSPLFGLKVLMWGEFLPFREGGRMTSTVFYEVRDDDDKAVTGPKALGTPTASNASNAVRPATSSRHGLRADGDPTVVAVQPDGQARLFEFDQTTNTYVATQTLFKHKNNVGDLTLIDLGDGRLLLAYVIEKNAKKNDLFLLVIDL